MWAAKLRRALHSASGDIEASSDRSGPSSRSSGGSSNGEEKSSFGARVVVRRKFNPIRREAVNLGVLQNGSWVEKGGQFVRLELALRGRIFDTVASWKLIT